MYELALDRSTEDPERGDWLLRAAQSDHAPALVLLGAVYWQNEDRDGAEACFRKAARLGDAGGMYNCGSLLSRHDPVEADRWLRAAADQGMPEAWNLLGVLAHENGNEGEAEALWQQGVQSGSNTARQNLTDRYTAAAREGHVPAMLKLAELLDEHDRDAALEWYERAANEGDPHAMLMAGMHHAADGAIDTACVLFRRGADAGNLVAMNNLGVLLYERAPAEAREWLTRAADGGNVQAMSSLAVILEGTEVDEALRWYARAAERGSHEARQRLAALQSDIESTQFDSGPHAS
jgi:TPR repeat protein